MTDRHPSRQFCPFISALLLSILTTHLAANETAPASPTLYVKKPSLQQTLLATRAHYCSWLFAARVRELYPGCPAGTEHTVAEHACRKYSGRVGRSAAAKAFDEEAVRLAVIAHVRHTETNYDLLLSRGYSRSEARATVEEKMDSVLAKWTQRIRS